jgi:hypothetical protein
MRRHCHAAGLPSTSQFFPSPTPEYLPPAVYPGAVVAPHLPYRTPQEYLANISNLHALAPIAARAMPVPIAIASTPLDRPLLPSQQSAQYTGQHERQSFGSYHLDPLNQMTSHSWANVTQASGQSLWGPPSHQRPVYSTLRGSQRSMATTNSTCASASSSFTPALNPSFNLENWSNTNFSFRTT